jgi:hypothetical protein
MSSSPLRNIQVPSVNIRSPTIPIPSSDGMRMENTTFSPINEHGCFEFDRILKSGVLLKRGKRTKTWKPAHLVLRPLNASIYNDAEHTKIRHQISLSDITAVARRKDPKKPSDGFFTIYTPSRNFHFDARTQNEAGEWIERIRGAARIDEYETGLETGLATSEDEGLETTTGAPGSSGMVGPSGPRNIPGAVGSAQARRQFSGSHGAQDQFGASVGSFSSISSLGAANFPGSSLSLSLSPPQGTTATNITTTDSNSQAQSHQGKWTGSTPSRQVSQAAAEVDQERVLRDGWMYLLKSKGGVKKWKPVWTVLRARTLAIYPNEQVRLR